jgi:Spy/CpxP family protein refolding chaperone
MNRLLVPAALALALAGSVAVAQNPTTPPPDGQKHFNHHHSPNPQRQAEHLSKTLNLTPDQTAKLTPIFADRDQKMAALFQNQQLAPQDKHQQMHAIQKSTNEQLATVLTPDQLQQLKSMHHEHGDQMRHGRPGTQPLTPQASPSA